MICLHHAQPVVVIVGSQWGTITIGFATSKDSHERKKFYTFRPLRGDGVAQVLTVPFYYVVVSLETHMEKLSVLTNAFYS